VDAIDGQLDQENEPYFSDMSSYSTYLYATAVVNAKSVYSAAGIRRCVHTRAYIHWSMPDFLFFVHIASHVAAQCSLVTVKKMAQAQKIKVKREVVNGPPDVRWSSRNTVYVSRLPYFIDVS
jgi:hypothetical protein